MDEVRAVEALYNVFRTGWKCKEINDKNFEILDCAPLADIEFLLPQLANIYLYQTIDVELPRLERFLVVRSAESVHFALRLAWLLESAATSEPLKNQKEQENLLIAVRKKANQLRQTVEGAAVNKDLVVLEGQQAPSATPPDTETLMARAIAQQKRCAFFANQMHFIHQLMAVSDRLRVIPREASKQRKALMVQQLEALNGEVGQNTYYIPMATSADPFHKVLSVCSKEAILLASRERCPYMLFVEVAKTTSTCGDPDLDDTIVPYLTNTDDLLGSKPTEREPSEEQKTEQSPNSSTKTALTDNTAPPTDVSIQSVNTTNSRDPTSPSTVPPTENGHLSTGDSSPTTDPREGNSTPRTPKSMTSDDDLSTSVMDFELLSTEVTEEARWHAYGELFLRRKERLREISSFGTSEGWDCQTFIVKAGDDIRQEEMAMQLITAFQTIWDNAGLPLWVRPTAVVVCSADSGLIETITDAASVDGIKKKSQDCPSLLNYFEKVYGPQDSVDFKTARRNFIESMAGYAVITYILQVKDRHNGNIMLTTSGHIVHIDFGFMLSSSPGNMNFESAPFKLTNEFVGLMGGTEGEWFRYFQVLVYAGFLEIRKHADNIVSLVEMMLPGHHLPCFNGDGANSVRQLRERFHVELKEFQLAALIRDMIETSVDNWRTRQYDNFQKFSNGIL